MTALHCILKKMIKKLSPKEVVAHVSILHSHFIEHIVQVVLERLTWTHLTTFLAACPTPLST